MKHQALVPDDLWEAIEPFLPKEPSKPKGGRPRVPDRAALAGIVFVLREPGWAEGRPSTSAGDGDDLRAGVGERTPVPVDELLLDPQARAGKEPRQLVGVEEPERAPAHLRAVPPWAGERADRADDAPRDRLLHPVVAPHDGAVGVGHLARVFLRPALPGAVERVAGLEREAPPVDEGRPDGGEAVGSLRSIRRL